MAEVVTASGMAVAELHEDYFSPEVTEAFLDLQRKWKEFSEPELMFSLKKTPTKNPQTFQNAVITAEKLAF